jgi:hypothetical protein
MGTETSRHRRSNNEFGSRCDQLGHGSCVADDTPRLPRHNPPSQRT